MASVVRINPFFCTDYSDFIWVPMTQMYEITVLFGSDYTRSYAKPLFIIP